MSLHNICVLFTIAWPAWTSLCSLTVEWSASICNQLACTCTFPSPLTIEWPSCRELITPQFCICISLLLQLAVEWPSCGGLIGPPAQTSKGQIFSPGIILFQTRYITYLHSTKKPVTTMLTYPWKCTVLHCNHLGNIWKPLVLMTWHFDYFPSASAMQSKCGQG